MRQAREPIGIVAAAFTAIGAFVAYGCGERAVDDGASIPNGRVSGTLRGASTYPLKRAAFVLVDTGAGVNLTAEQARGRLVGPTPANDSLRAHLFETSYGTQDLDGLVVGPLQFPTTACNTAELVTTLRAMVDAAGGGPFNHYVWYLGQPNPACTWQALAEIGVPDRPANDSYLNAQSTCPLLFRALGHNAGMLASYSLSCGAVPLLDSPDGVCTAVSYGDPFDGMGGACAHVNGWQKIYSGWLQGCNAVRVRATGTFTLVPIELPCAGVQVLQIPMAKTRVFNNTPGQGSVITTLSHYYLELRAGRGLDGGFATSVQVRVSTDIRGRQQRGHLTWILDMNPATAAFDGLAAGGSYTDPAGGVTFAVTALDSDHATVVVTLESGAGDPLCIDGTTVFVPPGRGIESCDSVPAGTPVTSGAGGRTGGAGGMGGLGGRGQGGLGSTGDGGAGGATASGGSSASGGATASGGSSASGGATGSGAGGSGLNPATGDAGVTGATAGRSLAARNSGCSCALATQTRNVPASLAFGLLGFLIRRRRR